MINQDKQEINQALSWLSRMYHVLKKGVFPLGYFTKGLTKMFNQDKNIINQDLAPFVSSGDITYLRTNKVYMLANR